MTTYEEACEEAGPRLEPEERLGLYRRCWAEGHLIVSVLFGEHEDDDSAWLYACTCGENSGYDGIPSADEGIILRSFDDGRWWARGHRQMHGLDWQPWIFRPTAEQFLSHIYHGEGHCVTVCELDDGMYRATCSCIVQAIEDDGYEPGDTDRCISADFSDVVEFAAEHRESVGLDRQQLVPDLFEVLLAGEFWAAVRGESELV